MRFQHVNADDLGKMEWTQEDRPSHFFIEDELLKIAGAGYERDDFLMHVLREFGYNDHLEARRVRAYNRIADILNGLPTPITKANFCRAAGIPYQAKGWVALVAQAKAWWVPRA